MAPVLSHRRGVATSQEMPKSANNHRSHTISAVVVARARSSASVLERDTAACFLDFHAIGEEPRRMQYLLGHSPKWNPSKHEAEADYHAHRVNFEMMSPVGSVAREVNVQNERSWGTNKLTQNMDGMSNITPII